MRKRNGFQIVSGNSNKDSLCGGSKNVFSKKVFDRLSVYATMCETTLLDDYFLANSEVNGNCYTLYSIYKKKTFTKCGDEIDYKMICQSTSTMNPGIVALIVICCVGVLIISTLVIRKCARRYRRANHYKAFGSENTLVGEDLLYSMLEQETGSENGLESSTNEPAGHQSSVASTYEENKTTDPGSENLEDKEQDESHLKRSHQAGEKEKSKNDAMRAKGDKKDEVSSSRFLKDFTVLELLGGVS